MVVSGNGNYLTGSEAVPLPGNRKKTLHELTQEYIERKGWEGKDPIPSNNQHSNKIKVFVYIPNKIKGSERPVVIEVTRTKRGFEAQASFLNAQSAVASGDSYSEAVDKALDLLHRALETWKMSFETNVYN